jgi:hypothetical protein
VEFTGLTVTPYVSENSRRARLAFSFRATGVHAQGKAPADPAQRPAAPGEGKAA